MIIGHKFNRVTYTYFMSKRIKKVINTTIYLFILFVGIPMQSQDLAWEYGRNDLYVEHENTPRHFIVHVPQKYDDQNAVPVVFVFHGTNGQGHTMWLNSKWVQLCELENFITVYPSSWKYPLLTGKISDKWNFSHLYEIVVRPDSLKDDVGFIHKVLDGVIKTFNVDTSRIYATGFSNGNSFVHTRIIPEMNDRFAAVAGNAGLIKHKYIINGPLLPAITMIGTQDGKILEGHPDTILPFSVQGILTDPALGNSIDSSVFTLKLEKQYTLDSSLQSINFHFKQPQTDQENEWHFIVINRMGHVYPNGSNNLWNLEVAPIYWEFFKRFPKHSTGIDLIENSIPKDCQQPQFISLDLLDVSCFKSHFDAGKLHMVISDVLGRRVMAHTIQENSVSLHSLETGIYLITLSNRRGQKVTYKYYKR